MKRIEIADLRRRRFEKRLRNRRAGARLPLKKRFYWSRSPYLLVSDGAARRVVMLQHKGLFCFGHTNKDSAG